MFKDYVDYEIEIQPRRGTSFPFAAHSPGGQAIGKLRLPTDDSVYQQLMNRLLALDTNEAMLGQIGQILFKALFQGQAKEVYVGSQGTLQENQGLRIKLNIAVGENEVAMLPWELLNDPDRGPLALLDMPVVRYLPQPIRIPTLKTTLPLKILLTGAQTPPPAQVERELAEIEKTLVTLGSQVRYVIEPHLTTSILRQRLREGFHIWHFVGHGGFTNDDTTATLRFEDEHGDLDEISATQLGIMLNRSSVRLILLDACESGKLATDPFRSIAPALIRAQVPAVVAMQFPVSQDSTRAFAREFYRTLTEGFPIDACVTEARKAVVDVAGLRSPDWGIPVVYTRAPDGKLFELPIAPSQPPTSAATTPQTSGVNISFGDNNRVDGNNIIVDNVGNNTTSGSTTIQSGAKIDERAAQVASLNELLARQHANLNKLKLQAAGFGGSMWTPIALMNQIEDVESEISKLERQLKALGG